jgi:hypothetical protein
MIKQRISTTRRVLVEKKFYSIKQFKGFLELILENCSVYESRNYSKDITLFYVQGSFVFLEAQFDRDCKFYLNPQIFDGTKINLIDDLKQIKECVFKEIFKIEYDKRLEITEPSDFSYIKNHYKITS